MLFKVFTNVWGIHDKLVSKMMPRNLADGSDRMKMLLITVMSCGGGILWIWNCIYTVFFY